MKTRAAWLFAAHAVLATACEPREVCGGASPSCGGNVVGTWDVVVSSCQDEGFAQAFEITLNEQPVLFAREDIPERTGVDWCSQLVFQNGAVEGVRLTPQTVPVVGGMMSYTADGGYTGTVTFSGSFAQSFPRVCLEAHGGAPTCQEFDVALNTFVRGSSGLTNVSCVDGDNDGCRCNYTLTQVAAFSGQWSTEGGVLTHFDAFQRLPNEVDYCVGANQLEMVGHQRGFLWDRIGLRGLVWAQSAAASP